MQKASVATLHEFPPSFPKSSIITFQVFAGSAGVVGTLF